jgi:hypothetical protein
VSNVTLPGGTSTNGTSNFVVDGNRNCLTSIQGQYPATTIPLPILVGTQTVTPASIVNIVISSTLQVDASLGTAENVTVTSVTLTTFTANFSNAHVAGATMSIIYQVLTRVDQSANTVIVSQDFSLNNVNVVAASPNNAAITAFATTNQRLFLSTNTTATTPTWSKITISKPARLQIASIAINKDNNTFVLFSTSVITGGGEFETTSPLFLISTNS